MSAQATSKHSPVEIIQTISTATAIGVGIAYAAGLLIVSIHDARYGIVQLSPLNPRVLLTGAVFMGLVSVAAFVAFRDFGFLGVRSDDNFSGTPEEGKPPDLLLRKVNNRLLLSSRATFYRHS